MGQLMSRTTCNSKLASCTAHAAYPFRGGDTHAKEEGHREAHGHCPHVTRYARADRGEQGAPAQCMRKRHERAGRLPNESKTHLGG
jgi:hypothetical protein